MRICTYNIWNADTNFDKRLVLLIEEIKKHDIDILALQEVRDKDVVDKIADECGFSESFWKKYDDENEGLAILSKSKMLHRWTNWDDGTDNHDSGALCTTVEHKGKKLTLVNVHLDYESRDNRETELINCLEYLETQASDYKFFLGDFNSYEESRLHRFMRRLEPLMARNEDWIDLGEAYKSRVDKPLKATLDFVNNPRWKGQNSLERPGRFDWIMLQNIGIKKYPKLINYQLLGTKETDGMTPSDHYGVMIELDF